MTSSVVSNSLVGPNRPEFDKPCVRPPKYTVDHLRGSSIGLCQAVLSKVLTGADEQLEQKTWKLTQEEVEKGWIVPTTNSDLDQCFLAHRFGIVQGEKIRLIDDFSLGGLNGTFGLTEKLGVEPVDAVISILAVVLDSDASARKVVGRTYDLVSAYKQFGVSPQEVDRLRVVVKAPGKSEYAVFKVLALPFGAVGSVAAFLRVAASISFLARRALKLAVTAFFDDFTCLSQKGDQASTDFAITGLFKLLGVDYAREGKKAPDFSDCFACLGVVVDLGHFGEGQIRIKRTEQRRHDLAQQIREILTAGEITHKTAEKLRGRMTWFSSFLFGRQANAVTRMLGQIVKSGRRQFRLDKEHTLLLDAALQMVAKSEPVKITRNLLECWVVFTDGSYEPASGRPGAIGGCYFRRWVLQSACLAKRFRTTF